MAFNPRSFFRKWHRWASALIAVPFLVVIVTGLLLQVKKWVPWVQPPMVRGEGKAPTVSFEKILQAAMAATEKQPEVNVRSWDDIDRIDVRIDKGICKVLCRSRWEVQVDLQSGYPKQTAYRRSDLIEELHDGSWFHAAVKDWVFMPTAGVVFTLWMTGIYLFALPWWVKWRRKKPGALA